DQANGRPLDVHRLRLGAGMRLLPRLTHLLYQKDLTHATFSPDGRYLVTTSEDKFARLVDARSGAVVLPIEHDDVVNHAAFSSRTKYGADGMPEGLYLVTASGDPKGESGKPGEARLWHVAADKTPPEAKLIRTLLEHREGPVTHATFDPLGW